MALDPIGMFATLLLSGGILAGILYGHSRPAKVPREARWPSGTAIDVVVTADCTPECFIAVVHAVAIATSLGHKVGNPRRGAPLSPVGAIVFDVPGQGFDPMSENGTCLRAVRVGMIGMASIQIPTDLRDRTLRLTVLHELFHALGFGHVARTGHVMHPRSESQGDETSGLDA